MSKINFKEKPSHLLENIAGKTIVIGLLTLLLIASHSNRAVAQDIGTSLTGLVNGLASGTIVLELTNELSSNSFPVISGLNAQEGNSLQSLVGLGSSTVLAPQGLFLTLTGLGLPLVAEYAPVLGVLMDNPAASVGFLLDGPSTILSPSFALFPAVPLINAPLSGDF